MLALRIVGGIFAAALLVLAVLRYRRRSISRLNLLITWVLALGVILLAIAPVVFQPLFDLFNFGKKGSGRRLIAVELFGLLIVFALIVRNMVYTDANERALRLLIEAENVAAVIRDIPRAIEGYPVVPIVVDDASDDGTGDVARQAGAIVIRNPIRRGGGLALRVGYDVASRRSAEVVVSLDADGQHIPEEMRTLVLPVLRGEADMVNGSRLLGDFVRESIVRHIGVHFFSRMVTIMTGQRITDPSSGYRATRVDVLRKFVLTQDQFWTSELLIEGLRHRARIIEVPITIKARAGGKSKKPKSLKYGWNFSKAIIQTWLR